MGIKDAMTGSRNDKNSPYVKNIQVASTASCFKKNCLRYSCFKIQHILSCREDKSREILKNTARFDRV